MADIEDYEVKFNFIAKDSEEAKRVFRWMAERVKLLNLVQCNITLAKNAKNNIWEVWATEQISRMPK